MIKPICPHCEVSLNRTSRNGIFRYSCPSCHGFSITYGGLKKVLTKEEIQNIWQARLKTDDSKVTCSHCRRNMKVVYAGAKPTELDLCSRCDLVWFDTGEWSDLDGDKKTKAESDSTVTTSQIADPVYIQTLLETERLKQSRPYIDDVQDMKPKHYLSIVGLVVEEDSDEFKIAPWVTWLLIAICCTVTFYALKNEEWALQRMAYIPGYFSGLNLGKVITSFFVHGSFFHLASNMYFLWVFGDNVEDHLGKSQYLLLLFLSTMLGAFAFGLFDPSGSPLVGASGGISGVVAFYLYRFPHRKFVTLWFFKFFAIPGFLLGGLFLVAEIIGTIGEVSGRSGGIAHLAHLGGAAAGLIFAIMTAPPRSLKRLGRV